jgi:hypothetical protein
VTLLLLADVEEVGGRSLIPLIKWVTNYLMRSVKDSMELGLNLLNQIRVNTKWIFSPIEDLQLVHLELSRERTLHDIQCEQQIRLFNHLVHCCWGFAFQGIQDPVVRATTRTSLVLKLRMNKMDLNIHNFNGNLKNMVIPCGCTPL